ncbi:SAVED domain-containing protein [Myxococcus sp. Y35]|uniref:SAVED domain-containing protein n=1 Tax=Pseudomyxococcus flavus TaxID=3115648 RepID=UPI003CF9F301
MGEQSASRLEGDRYQHLLSWYELLRLLDVGSPFEHGYVEHPEAGSADDVTLHARPGSGVASRYMQVKWHVDHRDTYSLAGLVTPPRKGSSLLRKLLESWQRLRLQGPVEVWLLSNWASAEDLGKYLHGRSYRFTEAFFEQPPRGALKKHWAEWEKRLGVPAETLRAFCRDLRLRLGVGGIQDIEEQVDDRMGRLGLRMGRVPRAIVLDGLREWIELGGGGKRVTPESLREAIRAWGLLASREDVPAVSLWIHGWARRTWEQPPTEELDWTRYFDRDTRRVPSEAVWRDTLLPGLLAARQRLASRPDGALIDLRGKLPLSTVLAVGFHFLEVGGYRFRVEQPTRGETFLWRSDARPSQRRLRITGHEGHADATELLVVFQMTGDARADVERFVAERPGAFRAVLYLEPEDGPHDGAVGSDADAVAFAIQAREQLRRARNEYRAAVTHLILYAPASCCLFLGQRLNAVGAVVSYERTGDGGYAPALTLQTG